MFGLPKVEASEAIPRMALKNTSIAKLDFPSIKIFHVEVCTEAADGFAEFLNIRTALLAVEKRLYRGVRCTVLAFRRDRRLVRMTGGMLMLNILITVLAAIAIAVSIAGVPVAVELVAAIITLAIR